MVATSDGLSGGRLRFNGLAGAAAVNSVTIVTVSAGGVVESAAAPRLLMPDAGTRHSTAEGPSGVKYQKRICLKGVRSGLTL